MSPTIKQITWKCHHRYLGRIYIYIVHVHDISSLHCIHLISQPLVIRSPVQGDRERFSARPSIRSDPQKLEVGRALHIKNKLLSGAYLRVAHCSYVDMWSCRKRLPRWSRRIGCLPRMNGVPLAYSRVEAGCTTCYIGPSRTYCFSDDLLVRCRSYFSECFFVQRMIQESCMF